MKRLSAGQHTMLVSLSNEGEFDEGATYSYDHTEGRVLRHLEKGGYVRVYERTSEFELTEKGINYIEWHKETNCE